MKLFNKLFRNKKYLEVIRCFNEVDKGKVYTVYLDFPKDYDRATKIEHAQRIKQIYKDLGVDVVIVLELPDGKFPFQVGPITDPETADELVYQLRLYNDLARER